MTSPPVSREPRRRARRCVSAGERVVKTREKPGPAGWPLGAGGRGAVRVRPRRPGGSVPRRTSARSFRARRPIVARLPGDARTIAPQLLEGVELAVVLKKEVDHDVGVVDEHPLALAVALETPALNARLA